MTHSKQKNGALNIICAEDCGNAPKKEFLKKLNIALANHDVEFILENLTDDIVWNIIGDKVIQGKEQVVESLNQFYRNLTEMTISSIITHGYDGATNGTLSFGNRNQHAFCSVYKFNSSRNHAQVKEITSYLIQLS